MNYEDDDNQENETNSSKYSDPMSLGTGGRASFHSAYSPEDTAENEKQPNNLLENNDNVFGDIPIQPVIDKMSYEPPNRNFDRKNSRDFPLVQHTYENTYIDRKNSSDFRKDFGGNSQKSLGLMTPQAREIESFRDIPMVHSEFVPKNKPSFVQDDLFKKKNKFEPQEEVDSLYQPVEQEVMSQQREFKRGERSYMKESGASFEEPKKSSTPKYGDMFKKEENKAKEIEIEREKLREKQRQMEREKELERQRERERELERERERERELERERQMEQERQRQEREKQERERQERERQEKERKEKERQEKEKLEREKQERERQERERQERERQERERELKRQQELEKEREEELERQREKERQQKEKEKQKLAELERVQAAIQTSNVIAQAKQPDSKTTLEESKQKVSRNSSMDTSQKGRSMELYDNFVDEDTLYPLKKESGRISKTIETQTNDREFPSGYVTGLQSERVEISIPETKIIRDGLIYTYLVYKIVTKLKDEDDQQTEFTVFRRYSDFDWLFENIINKYHGYVIPVPPPKNILTAFNKEGVEFSETRKKELAIFLRKCMQHPFLKNTPELNIFLSDERGFLDFKKKEQALNQSKKDSALPLLGNISKMIHGATKGKPYHLREMDGSEGDLYNYEVTFMNIKKRLQSFSTQKLEQLQLQKKQTAALLSFTHQLQNTLSCSRYSKLDNEFQKVTSPHISEIEDNAIKDLTEKVESHLKDIISNVDAVIAAIERRNELARELNGMHEAIEEKSLKFKKDFTNGDELEELKKEYERLKKRLQEATEILLKELKVHKEKIDHDLALFLQSMSGRKEQYFKEVYNLWCQTCQEQ